MQSSNELPWLTALQTNNIHLLTPRSCDPNLKDCYGFSALHLYIIALLFDTIKSRKINYKTIVYFLNAGFDVDSQCQLGFTSLCLTQFVRVFHHGCTDTGSEYDTFRQRNPRDIK